MNKGTSLETRMRILELSQTTYTDQQIADEVGYSVPTVRKWRRRGQRHGRIGLVSQMGRPHMGALSSFPETMCQDILLQRLAHPGWGPNTLVGEIGRDRHWQGERHPSRSSIARLLKEHGLTRSYERHSQLPEEKRKPAKAPHDVWEVDARGHEYVPEVGFVALIDVKDRCSRARLLSFPAEVGQSRWKRHPNTEDHQMALRLAFTDWGLPRQVHVDHASVFFDNTNKSPFPTRFHLWLVALGIAVSFSRRRRATDQAMVERSHQLWEAQVLRGQVFLSWHALYQCLCERREFVNTSLPCASLNGLPPLLAFPDASHSGRSYRPEWEAELLDMDRVFDYLAKGKWFRIVSKDGNVSLGRIVFSAGRKLAHQQLEITVDSNERCFVCHDAAGDVVARRPAKRLDKTRLMGSFSVQFNLPVFQLALPFSDETQQVLRLFETMSVTT